MNVLRACLIVSALATVTLTLNAGAAPSQGPLPPEVDKELARSLLAEMVESRTTHDVGSTELAQGIQSHFLHAGFAAEDVVFIAPPDHPTKGNLVVRYRGKGRGKPLLLLGHRAGGDADPPSA